MSPEELLQTLSGNDTGVDLTSLIVAAAQQPEKVPMSPETSAGLNSPFPTEAPAMDVAGMLQPNSSMVITPELRAWMDRGYEIGNQGVEEINRRLAIEQFTAADAALRDTGYTGEPNTKGGVARVNQYTKDHGVIASFDEKGRVTLTNLDPNTGKPTPQSQRQFYGFNPMDRTTEGSVNSLVESLRSAKDIDSANGIASTLRSALATEESRLMADSIKFAETEVGLPRLKEQLALAEQIDRRQPGWVPGIGDSQNTARIRSAIYAAQNQASQLAKQRLENNLSYKQLKVAAENADSALRVIGDRSKRTEAIQDRAEAATATRLAREEEEAMQLYDSLSDKQRMVAMRVAPASVANDPAKIARYVREQAKRDPQFLAVIQADPEQVPRMAIAGNSIARNIIVSEEATATGKDPAQIEMVMKQAAQSATSTEALRQYTRIKTAGQPGSVDEARKMQGELIALRNSSKKEDQKLYQDRLQDIAYTLYKNQRNAEFENNVGAWGAPELQPFVDRAMQATGKADFSSVLTAMLEGKSGSEAIAEAGKFKKIMLASASKYDKSPFGPLNGIALSAKIDAEVANNGLVAQAFRRALTGVDQAGVVGGLFTSFRN